MFVPLSEETVAELVKRRKSPEESLDHIISRLLANSEPEEAVEAVTPPPSRKLRLVEKYTVEILDYPVGANSLGKLQANVVDAVCELDPDVVERLATMKARERRYVARSRDGVHLSSPHLPVLRTHSGWYVSKNVGREDVKRFLKALCVATGLEFGTDIRFGTI